MELGVPDELRGESHPARGTLPRGRAAEGGGRGGVPVQARLLSVGAVRRVVIIHRLTFPLARRRLVRAPARRLAARGVDRRAAPRRGRPRRCRREPQNTRRVFPARSPGVARSRVFAPADSDDARARGVPIPPSTTPHSARPRPRPLPRHLPPPFPLRTLRTQAPTAPDGSYVLRVRLPGVSSAASVAADVVNDRAVEITASPADGGGAYRLLHAPPVPPPGGGRAASPPPPPGRSSSAARRGAS